MAPSIQVGGMWPMVIKTGGGEEEKALAFHSSAQYWVAIIEK